MSLLPSSASRLMHVLAETIDARLAAIPVPGPETVRPETAPEAILPFLAWGWSVDLWDRDWPMATKRSITADALEMHRLKGTPAGIRRYLAYTAAKDVVITAPPQDFFLSAGPDDDPHWRSWIATLPEIRLYRVQSATTTPFGMWTRGGEDILPDSAFLADDDGLFLLAPARGAYDDDEATDLTEVEYAVMVVAGETVPLTHRRRLDTRVGKTGDVVEFRLPGWAGSGVFGDDCLLDGVDYLGGAAATVDWLRVALGPAVAAGSGWPLADERNAFVQDVSPEIGAYEVVSLIGLMASADFAGDAILDVADAGSGTYQSVRLIRPGLTTPPAASFWDDGRLGMAPYTAEIRMALPDVVSPALMYANAAYADSTFCAPSSDTTALEFALDAIEVSQAARDRLSINLNIPSPGAVQNVRRLSSLSLR